MEVAASDFDAHDDKVDVVACGCDERMRWLREGKAACRRGAD